MKRRNDSKKLGLDQAAIRELKPSDFQRSDGAALSIISPITPISPIIPIIPIAPVTPIVPVLPDDPVEC